ncbi:putative membrane protein DUF2079 [Actinocrispum wychmicini]|uniref:Putative membrane protein DUF2079 n=1 Tax=Actinocrispum wychmicini TaxID=1213861 RepID=A0A4R2IPK9_9PSEU|nr:putative membrane protein DUF2079 [Actinocrispum wychmicini]
MGGVFFVIYTLVSVTNHLRLGTTGYDLGIFEQAIRAYAHFEAPVSDLKAPGFVLLGDHFHPILATIAPVYRLFPSPITLMVAQAALLGVSAVPIVRVAQRRFGARTATAIGVAYGLSWGLQTTVDFDFHEVVFAVPLLAFSIECLLTQRWQAAVWWAAPLVLVKEDLPFTLAAIGLYVFCKGQRKLGLWTIAGALASFLLILLVIIPSMNPAGQYGFTHDLGSGGGLWDLLTSAPERLVAPQQKLFLLAALFAPTAFLALFSPVTALVIPTLTWRFISVNQSYWVVGFHYSAVLMPIIYFGLVDALTSGKRMLPEGTFRRVRRVAVVACVVMAVVGITGEPVGKLLKPQTWQVSQRATDAQRLMDMIPDDAVVAASNNLAPHLTNRCRITLFPHLNASEPTEEWIVTDTRFPNWPFSAEWMANDLARVRATTYRTVAQAGDFVLLRRI